ncbi:MAG: hypothetical protein M1820_010146 [Bogoriella megaspora]|nr:MAG: hypothetical protein M1820_010146 [Bogoriella megaspora]
MFRLQKLAFLTSLSFLHDISAASTNCTPNTWTNLTSIPSPRQEHSTVALNDSTIAIVGGIQFLDNNFVTTDLVQFYDIPSDTWRTVAPTPYKVNHPNVVAVGEKIYLLGGLIDGPAPSGSINWVASGESHVYDPASNAWTQLASMPNGTERGSAVTGVHGDIIYLAGGMTVLQNTYQDSVTVVTAFNTTSGQWQRLPAAAANIPEGRQHAVGSVIGDTFYVIGGRWFSQTAVRGTVFELNLNNPNASWLTSPSLMPTPRGGLSGDAVGTKYYTFGGEGDPNTSSGVFYQSESYDTATQQWNTLVSMTVPRHGTHAVAVGNRVYIPGGGLQQDGKAVTSANGTTLITNPSAHFDAYCA